MGRFPSTRLRRAATSLALALAVLAVAALPADAARRPPGPGAGGAEAARGRAHGSRCPFRWRKAKRARATTCASPATAASRTQMQTVHVRGARAHAAAAAGTLVLEGALLGQGQLALVEHPAGRRAPEGRRLPAVAADGAARHGRRTGRRHGHVRRLDGRPRASRATSCSRARQGARRGAAAPLTAPGSPARRPSCCGCARVDARRPCLAWPRRSPAPGAPVHRHSCRPRRPADVHAITVADTSVALAWDPAHDPDGTVMRYAVYRNGVLLGQPHSTRSWPRIWRPQRPTPSRSWRSTVAATSPTRAPWT